MAHLTDPSSMDAHMLPLGHVGIERLGRLSREAPHLKALAFESLLHMPLACLLDPDKQPMPADGDAVLVRLAQVRWRDEGIAEFSRAVFSDLKHFYSFVPERSMKCYTFANGCDLIGQMQANSDAPLIVDPRTPHALSFSAREMREWLSCWTYFLPAADPFTQGCEFQQVAQPAQVLLDRLAVFFACLEGVERAYLLRVRSRDAHEGIALLVTCCDMVVFERVRKAIPLLGWGLESDDFPLFAVPLAQHPELERDLAERLSPVYDQRVGTWLAPRPSRGKN